MALKKADFENMLKIDYHGPMVDLLENSTYFLSRAERYTEPTGGRHMYIPIRTGRTASIGARSDGDSETLPTGDRPTWGNATFPVKSLYATIRISGFSMRTSKPSALAFEKAMSADMEATVADMKKDVNRQIFGAGDAELAQVVSNANAGGTVNTVTVSNILYPTNPTKFLYNRMKFDIRTITTGADAGGGATVVNSQTIGAVTSTTVFTYSATAAFTTGTTAIYREDNVGLTAVDGSSTNEIKEIYGLLAALNSVDPDVALAAGTARITANFGGIDRGTAGNELWKGNKLSNAGVNRPFSVFICEQAIDESEIKGNGKISVIQSNHAIFRVHGANLAAAKQYDGAVMKLDGDWTALSVNGIPMVKDVECPDYHMFFIDESTLMLGVLGDWAWLEDDGGGILNRLPGQDQYEGVFNKDCNLMCSKPSANTIVNDIAHS